MTDEDIEKLITDLAEKYASKNQEFCVDANEEEITTYYDLRAAFMEGFKAGMRFKEEQ